MASKEKILESAQKFIAKGQLGKAIGEYQKLVDAFPRDFRYRQKIAELLTRDRRNEEAQPHYEAVAKNFTETGFYLKAIAIYKQMQKVEPNRVDLYLLLAELNEKHGLIGNALTEYRALIAFYEKNKKVRDALPVLQKMAVLDPENLGVRGKLIETLLSCHDDDAAREQFAGLVTFLEGKGEFGRIVKLYEKFQDLCADKPAQQLPLARALVATEQAGKALPILKGLLKEDSEQADVLEVLIDCHAALGQHEDARLVCQHLLKNYPDNLLLRERYVRLCLASGDCERALLSLAEARETFDREGHSRLFRELYSAAGGDQAALGELPGDASEAAPGATVPSFPEESATPVDLAPQASTLPRLDVAEPPKAPVASFGGLELELDLDLDLDFAAPAAAPVPAVDTVPEPVVAAREVGEGSSATPPENLQEVELDLELDLDGFDVDTLAPEDAGTAEPAAASPAELPAGPAPEREPSPTSGLEIDLDLGLSAEFELPPEVQALTAEPTTGVVEDGPSKLVGSESPAAEVVIAEEDFSPLETEVAGRLGEPEPAEEPESLCTAPAVATIEISPEEPPVEAFEELPAEAPNDAADVVEAEELEELDEVLEELEELDEFVDLEEVEEVTADEADVVLELHDPATGGGTQAVMMAEPHPAEFSAVSPQALLQEGLEEAEFYLRQGLLDDAERVLGELRHDFSASPEVVAKQAEIAQLRLPPVITAPSTESLSEPAEPSREELPGRTQSEVVAADDVDEFSLETPAGEAGSGEDLQSHFDLGIAYKEMGLLEDAVAEFDRASRDPARRLDCLTLKGQCQLEMGHPAAAETTYRQALDMPMLSDEGRQVLCYELGLLYEQLGRKREALDNYQIVANIDLFFRDVTDKLKDLRQELGVDDQAIEAVSEGGSGHDRISFI